MNLLDYGTLEDLYKFIKINERQSNIKNNKKKIIVRLEECISTSILVP